MRRGSPPVCMSTTDRAGVLGSCGGSRGTAGGLAIVCVQMGIDHRTAASASSRLSTRLLRARGPGRSATSRAGPSSRDQGARGGAGLRSGCPGYQEAEPSRRLWPGCPGAAAGSADPRTSPRKPTSCRWVCPRGQRTNAQKYCQPCTESPELYDWLYLGFMAMLPLVLHWFFIEWYSGKKSSSALFQHITALFECTMAAIITLLVSDPVGVLYIHSCRVLMLSDWYTMLYNPSPDYVTTVHCTHEAVYPLYTIVFIYYAFCLVLMMLLRPLLVKKIACGLGKSDRFKSIYAALYFFPILTVLQAVGGGLLYYAFPYIILVLSLVTLAVYMSASEIENCYDLLVRKKRLIVLFSHWLLHAYGIISISRVDKLEQDLPLLALVPTPALFYLFTAKFTEPSRILSEGANGH
uniref:JNK1/MAPK8 associated membrane protein n=2 Tax=Balaenoptera musculus TaxID=9771 RepID=A0A8C0HWZ6_BALMU